MTWLFFSPSGRIGRKTYMLAWLFWVLVLSVPLIQVVRNEDNQAAAGVAVLVLFAGSLVATLSAIMLSIKRLHDMNMPGAICICMFIPAISILALIAFCVWPGSSEPNDYGRLANWPKDE